MFIKSVQKKSCALTLILLCHTPSYADQVILDDLIVDGSACIGQDCANAENFGFDTLRLKENNLRLHFDDTSNSASFPANDWRIVINDSNNGGASYFGIEDATAGRKPFMVEGGAPNHSLYVDNSGRVGFGTNNPIVEMHSADGDTPTLRLEQDGSSGFTPQTWDVASNEANFFIRDTTHGSKLIFRIKPNSPADSVMITPGGVGIGVGSPDAKLHVDGTVHIVGATTLDATLTTSQYADVDATIADLYSQIASLSGGVNPDVVALTNRVAALEAENASLTARLTAAETAITNANTQRADLATRLQNIEDALGF